MTRTIDLSVLRCRLPDLVEVLIAAVAAGTAGLPEAHRALLTGHARRMAPVVLPTALDVLESGDPPAVAPLAAVRRCAAATAAAGLGPTTPLSAVGPALAVFTRVLTGDVPQLSAVERALVLGRAGQLGHRIAVAVVAGWTEGRAVVPPGPAAELDPVDRTLLDLVARGRSNQQIARCTAYSAQTVKWRLGRLMRAWDAANRAELVAEAFRRGVLPVAVRPSG